MTDSNTPTKGPTFDRLLRKCHNCIHLRIHLIHTRPPEIDDKLSWLLALDNLDRIRCRMGRIRYSKDDTEKVFTSKHVLRVKPKLDADCPDYDADN